MTSSLSAVNTANQSLDSADVFDGLPLVFNGGV